MIDFYFDFVSPFGYFASLRIEALARRHNLGLRWHPILVGVTVMKVMGLPPLFDIPLKGDYVKREVARYQDLFKIALARDPAKPPVTALAASRAMALLSRIDHDAAVQFAHAAYAAYWQEEADLNQPATVAAIAISAGVSASEIDRICGDAAKTALREEMDEAVAKGVFGSPFFLIDGEPFFGVDKLELIEMWLLRER